MKIAKLYVITVLLMLIALASCDSGTNPVVNDICATPVATPPGGTYSSEQSVTLTTTPADATIYYSTNGTIYFTYTAPITISTPTTLWAYAAKTGIALSDTMTASYYIIPMSKVAEPTATPSEGTYSLALTIELTTTTPSAAIYYTLDGTNPTDDSSTRTLYTSPISITESTTIKAYAVKPDMADSNVITKNYIINPPELPCISIGEVIYYLSLAARGDTIANPVELSVAFDLGEMKDTESNWQQLLQAIKAADKFVDLDLSACTMSATEFDPDYSFSNGKEKIVSLVLPNEAASITAGTYSNHAFQHFEVLKSVNGLNIVEIGEYAFGSCYNLSELSFPVVETIGDMAFSHCASLYNVSFPAAKTIGYDAFCYCSNLYSVNFPTVETIGSGAFSGCEILYSVSFPAAETIEEGAFSGCNILYSANFPAVKTIGDWAFYRCDSLYSVSFPAAETIGDCAFYRCGSLYSVSFPATKTIGENAFHYSGNLYSVSFPAAETIGVGAFDWCSSLYNLNFPAVKTIEEGAFFLCESLYSVSFPAAETIGVGAFYACPSLNEASFPSAATIEAGAFYACASLSELNIPAVNAIGDIAFWYSGDTALTITMGMNAPTLGVRMFYNDNSKTVTIKIPMGATGYSPDSSSFDGTPVTISGDNTDASWANGFRGGGWDGATWVYSEINGYGICGGSSDINQYITLNIVQE